RRPAATSSFSTRQIAARGSSSASSRSGETSSRFARGMCSSTGGPAMPRPSSTSRWAAAPTWRRSACLPEACLRWAIFAATATTAGISGSCGWTRSTRRLRACTTAPAKGSSGSRCRDEVGPKAVLALIAIHCQRTPPMRFVKSLAPGLLAIAFAAPAFSQSPELTLTRFDCGTPQQPTDVNQRFSDTFAFPGVKVQFVYSCYLIRHGNDYMMWDTGFAADAGPTAPRETVPQQLAKIGVKAEEVKFVGISHY